MGKAYRAEGARIDAGLLDSIIVGRVEPCIYAFTTQTVPNYLKVGDTYRPIDVRLEEWRKYYPNLEHICSRSAKIDDDTIFRDFSVHDFLENAKSRVRLRRGEIPNLPYYSREFFKEATREDIDEAIADIKQSKENNDGRYALYSSTRLPKTFTYTRGGILTPRENQQQVIQDFLSAKKRGRKNLLMFAVMRFGKSFTSMCCAKEIGAKRVLVVSAKADVREEWKKTVESIGNFDGYVFADRHDLERNKSFIQEQNKRGKCVVLFLTLQDLQGDEIKSAHKEVFALKWDLLLVDETHFGARAEHYGKILLSKKEAELQMKDIDTLDDLDDALKELRRKLTIHLSGTPYRILMGGEFEKEDIIAFVQFSDIAEAQREWNEEHKYDEETPEWENPYYGFPQMIRFAFQPNESSLRRLAQLQASGATTSFSQIFKPHSLTPVDGYDKFIYEDAVLDLLKAIDGSKEDSNVLSFLDNERIVKGELCRHMVFVLPYCASCDAMERLIREHAEEFIHLKAYKILNISGINQNKRFESTSAIQQEIAKCESEGVRTITFTVNRMLTGNTVPQWDTMLYLKQTASPEEYDQAVFRLQNPFIEEYIDNDSTIKLNKKPQTILVDFDPERIFRLQERKSQIYNVNTDKNGNSQLRERIEAELRISPIIILDNNKLREVKSADVQDAVRKYSETRSMLEEASETPVDLSLLDNPELRSVISSLNEINSKKGISIPSVGEVGSEGDDIEASVHGEDASAPICPTQKNALKSQDEERAMANRFASYYALMLFFAFLTDDEVASLEDIIKVMDKPGDNIRIAKNLGLSAKVLGIIQKKSNPFVLRKLDYKIQNANSLNRDTEKGSIEKVRIALKKFGRMSESEIVTPELVADKMAGLLPDDVFERGPVLDIASKQGEFATALVKHFGPSARDKIYSLCTSKLAYEFTRKVYKLLSLPVDRIFHTTTSYDIIKRDKGKDYNLPKEIKDMKFSAIIGNPPYQEVVAQKESSNGQKVSVSIFQHFQVVSDDLAPYSVLIYPGVRWIHRFGKGLEQFGHDLINDIRLKRLEFYPDSIDLFDNVGIADGLSIVIKDKSKDVSGFKYIYSKKEDVQEIDVECPGESVFSLNPRDAKIVECIDRFVAERHLEYLHEAILPRSLFAIESDFVENNPDKVREYKEEDFNPETEIKLFTNDKAGKAGRARWYIADRSVITSGEEHINRWKVIVSSANAGGQKRSNQLSIADNHSAFGRARVALRSFETEAEAKNFYSYCRSELIRFAFLLTDESLTSLAKKVPDLINYTDDNGLIDFSGDIDAQLYDILDIGEREQKHIRATLASKPK